MRCTTTRDKQAPAVGQWTSFLAWQRAKDCHLEVVSLPPRATALQDWADLGEVAETLPLVDIGKGPGNFPLRALLRSVAGRYSPRKVRGAPI